MNSLYEKLSRFMYGRYGNDELNKFLSHAALSFVFLGFFIRFFSESVGNVIQWVGILFLVFSFCRMLSRRIVYRQKERNFYLNAKKKTVDYFTLQKNRICECKTHIYRKCPACKAMLRFPRVKGKHNAVCPRCGHHFEVNVIFGRK